MTLARRSYGLPVAMARDGIVMALVASAVVAHGQWLSVAIDLPPWGWIGVAIGVGVLAAIIARGLIGAVFVVAGFVLGLYLVLVIRASSAGGATDFLSQHGWLYATMLAAAVGAYLVVMLIIVRLRRST